MPNDQDATPNEDKTSKAKVILKPKRRVKKTNQALRKFFDLEAELGSDNEINDNRVKNIKGTEADDNDSENDSLLDDSFVDNSAPHLGDEVEIAKADEAVRDLFLAKQAEDEQNAI